MVDEGRSDDPQAKLGGQGQLGGEQLLSRDQAARGRRVEEGGSATAHSVECGLRIIEKGGSKSKYGTDDIYLAPELLKKLRAPFIFL